MNPLRNMDLYKAIVLGSLVLFPVGGYMIKLQNDEIVACERAIVEATKPGGLLEQIGQLQRKVEIVVQNKRTMSDAIKDPSSYFTDQVLLSASGSGLKTNDFQPLPQAPEPYSPRGSRQRVTDHIVEIKWARDDFMAGMDLVYALLFNCESGARTSTDQAQQSVWRLRELRLENGTDWRSLAAYKTPPRDLSDKWVIKRMKFARREPAKEPARGS